MDRKLRLDLIFRAAGNAKTFLGGVRGESERTSKAVGDTRAHLLRLKQTAKDTSSYQNLERGLSETRQALAAAAREAERLRTAHAQVEAPTQRMTRALEIAESKVTALTTKEAGQARGLVDLRSKLQGAGVAVDRLGDHQQRLQAEIADTNYQLSLQQDRLSKLNERKARLADARGRYDSRQELAGTMQGAGTSALAAGTAVAAPLFVAARSGMSFEDGMADVNKVVDFETPQQFRQMGVDILNLTTKIPMAAEGLTSIVAAAGQAGIARGELMGFAEDAAKMGIAFDTTAEDAGQKMATWRTAFKMTQVEVGDLADKVNYLGNNGPASALAISNVVTRIGPLGKVAGLAAGEIAALGSTIVGMGVEEEIAATGIKNTMLALTKGTAATKSQKSAYQALGLEAGAVAKAMQVDASGTIVDVLERVAKLDPEKQTSVLTQLFGSESVGAIAPMLTNLDVLKGNLNKVGDASKYAGSMQGEFDSKASTSSNAVLLAKNALKAFAIEIGTGFLPEIKAGAAWLVGVAKGIRAFAEEHPGATRAAVTLLAIIAGGLIVFGGLAMAAAAVLGPFALLQLALTQVGLLFATGGALGGVATIAGKVFPFLGSVLGWAGRMAMSAGGLLFRGLMIAGQGFLAFGAAAARAGVMLLFNPITWIVLAIVAAVALLAGAAYLVYRNWETISGMFGRVWNAILVGATTTVNFFRNLPSQFARMGADMISGLIRGIVGKLGDLRSTVVGAANSAASWFKNKLGIRSPSRVFAQFGDYTMQGLALGIDRSTGGALGSMRSAAAALTAAGAVSLSAGAASAAPREFVTGPRIEPRAAAGTSGQVSGAREIHVHIHAAPGMNEERLVQLAMERLRQETGAVGSASFDDTPGSWSED